MEHMNREIKHVSQIENIKLQILDFRFILFILKLEKDQSNLQFSI